MDFSSNSLSLYESIGISTMHQSRLPQGKRAPCNKESPCGCFEHHNNWKRAKSGQETNVTDLGQWSNSTVDTSLWLYDPCYHSLDREFLTAVHHWHVFQTFLKVKSPKYKRGIFIQFWLADTISLSAQAMELQRLWMIWLHDVQLHSAHFP